MEAGLSTIIFSTALSSPSGWTTTSGMRPAIIGTIPGTGTTLGIGAALCTIVPAGTTARTHGDILITHPGPVVITGPIIIADHIIGPPPLIAALTATPGTQTVRDNRAASGAPVPPAESAAAVPEPDVPPAGAEAPPPVQRAHLLPAAVLPAAAAVHQAAGAAGILPARTAAGLTEAHPAHREEVLHTVHPAVPAEDGEDREWNKRITTHGT